MIIFQIAAFESTVRYEAFVRIRKRIERDRRIERLIVERNELIHRRNELSQILGFDPNQFEPNENEE